jgi:hypothetical protein
MDGAAKAGTAGGRAPSPRTIPSDSFQAPCQVRSTAVARHPAGCFGIARGR